MEELECKKKFAAQLFAEPSNPFKAAQTVFGSDVGNCCKYALLWKDDPEVLEEIERIKNCDNANEFLPSKIETARLAWEMANNDFLKSKDRVAALRLFAEMLSFIPEKNTGKTEVKEEVVNRVMKVIDHGNDEEWENKILANQERLANGN